MLRRLCQDCRKTLPRRRGFAWLWTSSALLAVLLAAQPAQAQRSDNSAPAGSGSPASSPAASTSGSNYSGLGISPQPVQRQPEPEFQAGATFNVSDSYVSNSGGFGGARQPDYLAMIGGSAYVHQHSRRLNLDANYTGDVDFYAKGTLPTQVNTNLQAVGNLDAIPGYLSVNAKVFAQPVVISSLGIITADNRVVPNGFSNSYGYYVNPDLSFHLADFATSETLPSFGQIYFVSPAGSLNFSPIPGVGGPQDTTSRSLMQKISSGPYFERLNWDAIGSFSETDRARSLLSEKIGIANLRYALSYKVSLMATAGYDAITSSTPLNQGVSGPVALGGVELKFGKDFLLQVQVGEKYNSVSYSGHLLYNVTSTASITASADDYVQTPEGQLLNNLTNLTARADGSLGLPEDTLGNGSPSSLSAFNLQSQGSLSQDQNIARYQTLNLTFAKTFERYGASVGVFGTRRTILSGIFIGPATQDSWGGQAQLSHELSPLLHSSIGVSYSVNGELGGTARILQAQSQISYDLSRQTSIYVGVQYLTRSSSAFLQSLSSLTGNVDDFRASIGVSHAL